MSQEYQEYIDVLTPEHVALRFQTAGLGSRAAAQLIDMVIMYGALVLLFIALALIGELQPEFYNFINSSLMVAVLFLVLFLIIFGYGIFFEYFWGGQTPGKRLLGLRVRQEQGQPLTFFSAVVRNLLRLIDSLPLFYLLGCLVIFFHPQHQRIGDLVAGTIVVYQNRGMSGKEQKRRRQTVDQLSQTVEPLPLETLARKKFTLDDWTLLAAYVHKNADLSPWEREKTTLKIARILLPKAGLDPDEKSAQLCRQNLEALYLTLRDDWEHV